MPPKTSRTAKAQGPQWSKAELAEVRAVLETELQSLLGESSAASQHVQELQGTTSGADDPADSGANTYERESELAILEHAKDAIEQCREAITRIDAGTFGACEGCGQPIPKARLQAFPRATLCIACKQRQERRAALD